MEMKFKLKSEEKVILYILTKTSKKNKVLHVSISHIYPHRIINDVLSFECNNSIEKFYKGICKHIDKKYKPQIIFNCDDTLAINFKKL